MVKLQLLHQRNIVLYKTNKEGKFITVGSLHMFHIAPAQSYLDFIVALTRGIPSLIVLDSAFFVTEHIPDAQSFSIFVPGSFCLIG